MMTNGRGPNQTLVNGCEVTCLAQLFMIIIIMIVTIIAMTNLVINH